MTALEVSDEGDCWGRSGWSLEGQVERILLCRLVSRALGSQGERVSRGRLVGETLGHFNGDKGGRLRPCLRGVGCGQGL